MHDRDGNASKMIAKLGRDSLPRVAGEVKPVERPTVDDKEKSPKKQCPDMEEAGKVPALDAGSSIFKTDGPDMEEAGKVPALDAGSSIFKTDDMSG